MGLGETLYPFGTRDPPRQGPRTPCWISPKTSPRVQCEPTEALKTSRLPATRRSSR